MERKLRSLFDFQRFNENEHLSRVIGEVEKKYYKTTSPFMEKLEDDDLYFVNAAGEVRSMEESEKGRLYDG